MAGDNSNMKYKVVILQEGNSVVKVVDEKGLVEEILNMYMLLSEGKKLYKVRIEILP